ncbi:uncharacterized protein LOC122092435 [Macadamia integrifolia]|uniref:uncharacterized protein LOC122092435 n=1 Tax=Macadamia integrifolia TaxID=60698 RepID=UPI001C53139C|nr:uncharacterized protein LOC122092435 [Macadamia integrifolia]
MPSEMFWFKRIRQISPRQIYHLENAKSQTPQELFDKTHYDLLQKSEKWVKENAGVYMVISTLIASLMFTAAFTVPGGFNSDTGLPVLIHNKYLLPYFRLVSLSLFFSLATLATSLYTHCIHFQQEDFYFSLPLKIFLSSSNLFCCVISTVLAYGNARRLQPLPVTNIYVHYVFEAIRFFALLLALLVYVDVILPVCRFLKKLLFHSLSSHN